MNKNRFSDDRLMQISSMKELRTTRRKVAVRLEILEDKFENGTWSLFNVDTMLYGLARKAAGIKGMWDGAKEIFRNLRSGEVVTVAAPQAQTPVAAKPKKSRRRKRASEKSAEKQTTAVVSAPEEPKATEQSEPKPEAEAKPKGKSRRRRGGRRRPKPKTESQE